MNVRYISHARVLYERFRSDEGSNVDMPAAHQPYIISDLMMLLV